MKSFRTIVPPYRAPFQLTHADPLLLVGSCFTEHIGKRLVEGKFQTLVNPNGIVYNPVSIAVTTNLRFVDTSRVQKRTGGSFYHWDYHGSFSHPDEATFRKNIERARQTTAAFLEKTNYLFLTLGTAQVFALKETGQIVANNHKAPADWFEERRLSVAETVDTLAKAIEALRAKRPAVQVVLSVSPVRHMRNGFVENQRSKAVLLLACADLCAQFDFVHYFPAYEVLLDELRDYRFYADDMVHPSASAVEYIWEYFAAAFLAPETRNLLTQLDKIRVATEHRPLHPDTTEHQTFARQQLAAIEQLKSKYPLLDFSKEIAWFAQFCS